MTKSVLQWLLFAVCFCGMYACASSDDEGDGKKVIPDTRVFELINGEWVNDQPEKDEWLSMKFVTTGNYFCYSDNKENWSSRLKNITKGTFGITGNDVRAANGTTYLDMTITKINGYEFSARIYETALVLKCNKVVMRTHLTYGQSVVPPYSDLVDTDVKGYKSHDESIATVDNKTGEILAVANNGRTYIDIITDNGTAVIKVMVGNVNDGDESEVSPIIKETVIGPIYPIDNLDKVIIGRWIFDDGNIWEDVNILDDGKMYFSSFNKAQGISNDNATVDYTISNNNRIDLNVVYTGGLKIQMYWVFSSISKFSFTITAYNDYGPSGPYNYYRQVDELKLELGEATQPDYQRLLPNIMSIKGYKSRMPDIVEVDVQTGKIIAKRGGFTYIEIDTDEGIALVKVTVKDPILFYNFDEFVWSSRSKVNEQFGNLPSTIDDNSIIFDLLKGDFKSVMFTFDQELVSKITLLPKDNVSFTREQMLNVLNERYTPYPSMTTNTKRVYLNGNSEEDSNVIIVYYLQTKQLLFTQFKQ